ncbi:MAG: protein translocase subunit SecF [Christensenellales bacterium]|jgi:preprotein translocase subunit SecF
MKFSSDFKYAALISAVIILCGVIAAFAMGVNIGVDFTGGTLLTLNMGGEFDVADVTAALEQAGIMDAPVMKSGATGSAQNQAVVRMKAFADDETENKARQQIVAALAEKYPDVEIASVDRVGAVASADLVRSAILCVVIASALILIYIWIRFELMSGIAAVIMLMHDVAIMLALTILFRVQINSPFIAAVLTIVGYSINNTIVIFDRVRENGKFKGKKNHVLTDELVDTSVRESLSRAINTSITTLVTIVALYVLGVDSIKEFALPIIVGLIAGTYSSIFMAAPFWGRLSRKHKAGAR